jgi:hypothetical protein
MTINQTAEHLRSRGYDCKPQMLELLVEKGVVRTSSPEVWTRADVDAAADYFELFPGHHDTPLILGFRPLSHFPFSCFLAHVIHLP